MRDFMLVCRCRKVPLLLMRPTCLHWRDFVCEEGWNNRFLTVMYFFIPSSPASPKSDCLWKIGKLVIVRCAWWKWIGFAKVVKPGCWCCCIKSRLMQIIWFYYLLQDGMVRLARSYMENKESALFSSKYISECKINASFCLYFCCSSVFWYRIVKVCVLNNHKDLTNGF